ncbi:carbohydrate-binding module family 32 protein [Xylona heveae TC161]|uniref:alpha,alpha-trehalase n=1 Tax=Xylona heveae (strain CBS 132557 / TC161) TaxID=1328760 RepID=A0A165FPY5_XYLHT|nr:carbohydrate-binding module family 32 protein [Xylona heveae TC161]KZF21241.1 carbohydrate-binding module family 32 protein [Xylona heveae TC161]
MASSLTRGNLFRQHRGWLFVPFLLVVLFATLQWSHSANGEPRRLVKLDSRAYELDEGLVLKSPPRRAPRAPLSPRSGPPTLAKRQNVNVSATGAGTIYQTRFSNVTWNNDAWHLTTTNLDPGHYQSRISLGNGYIGLNLASLGPFFEVDLPVNGDVINEWPLFERRQTFAGLAGFYDYQPTTEGENFVWSLQFGGESIISGIPHWGGIVVELPTGQYLSATTNASEISDFSSTLDIKRGLMTWSFTWTPSNANGLTLDLDYSMFLHKLYVNQAAVQLQVTASQNVNVTLVDVVDGTSALRTVFVDKAFQSNQPTIWTAVRPVGISNVTAYVASTLNAPNGTVDLSSRVQITNKPYLGTNESSIAQGVNATLKANQTTIIEKFVGVASHDAYDDPQSTAINASISGRTAGFAQSLASHQAEWSFILNPNSVDSYAFPNGSLPNDVNLVEKAILAVTDPFHLLQNTVGANAIAAAGNNTNLDDNSISVAGLGSDDYGGMIFWDAETWMFPGLSVSHPEAAKQIPNYRVSKYPAALGNVKMAFDSSQNKTQFSQGAAVYPWTSGRFGNTTGTGPAFDYEYHINGDIAQSLMDQWIATGDTSFFKSSLYPVFQSIALFYSELIKRNDTSGEWYLTNMTDPDEFANGVENGAYTMALIADTLTNANIMRSFFNEPINQTFADQAINIDLPTDPNANLILEYDGMNGSISVKQADVILIDYPLNYPNNYSLSDLDYYAAKQSQNGPGMTYAIFSINANAFSPSGCSAYTYDVYASNPYVRAPWFQFSEQLVDAFAVTGYHPAFPFLTGIGGANQVNVFGYLGLRLQFDKLQVDPSLPPQIPQLKYRTIYWQGWPISAFSNQTHTTLSRSGSSLTPLSTANQTFSNTSIPVQWGNGANITMLSLSVNGTITITNRQPGLIKTAPGNIAQCLPVSSADAYVPGQFPIGAVDGAASTKWQPVAANVSASITVELASQAYQPITQIQFDWGQAPPVTYSVIFHNDSVWSESALFVSSSAAINISNPYDPKTVALLQSVSSNTTNVTLSPPIWSGNYATLVIEGNQASTNPFNGTGATVAEFVLVGANGTVGVNGTVNGTTV